MSEGPFGSAESLLPHAGKMVLLDRIVGFDLEGQEIRSEVDIGPDCMFYNEEDSAVPVWVGLEYMAQTIAAFSSLSRNAEEDDNAEPKIGLLLGTRRYTCSVDSFKADLMLEVTAKQSFFDSQLASFDCSIKAGDEVLAEAQVNAFQPDRIEDFID